VAVDGVEAVVTYYEQAEAPLEHALQESTVVEAAPPVPAVVTDPEYHP